MKPSVRLYGPLVGHGSYCRVAAGMRRGLEAIRQLAGFVPIDSYDDECPYDGTQADIGVYVGPPGGAATMSTIGLHRHRLVLLPPNSTLVPAELLAYVREYATGLFAPSEWAVKVLQGDPGDPTYPKLTDLPVQLWRHGVDPAFRESFEAHAALGSDFEQGHFRVLHLASTAAQRKGTKELLIAWARVRHQLPPKAHLTMVVDGPDGVFREEVAACGDSVSFRNQRLNLDAANMATLYQRHHAVACPSRGEAFGLCVPEALCCGVPVVATTCTGHGESTLPPNDLPGIMPIKTGGLGSIDDGIGALAPTLDPDDVAAALSMLASSWTSTERDALAFAPHRRRIWSWEAVTDAWWQRYYGSGF